MKTFTKRSDCVGEKFEVLEGTLTLHSAHGPERIKTKGATFTFTDGNLAAGLNPLDWLTRGVVKHVPKQARKITTRSRRPIVEAADGDTETQ